MITFVEVVFNTQIIVPQLFIYLQRSSTFFIYSLLSILYYLNLRRGTFHHSARTLLQYIRLLPVANVLETTVLSENGPPPYK